MNISKKEIKKLVPDRLIYFYKTACLVKPFLKARQMNNTADYPIIKFYSDKKTVDKIVDEGMSLSRYGDGEFMWMSGERHSSFQSYSLELSKALRKAFCSRNQNLLIGIPIGIQDTSKCNLYAKMYWNIIRTNFMPRLMQFIDADAVYCNASITRPYIDYRSRKYSKECFDNIRRIWNGRTCVFVEGSQTKMGMGNDLFDNATSCRRIICPAQNAFEKLNVIKDIIREKVDKSELILAALGPTASVLAADMCEEGYQVIDIGHVDVEYMWYLNKSILRDPIDGKYVNESGLKTSSDKYDQNKIYKQSVIAKIE